MGIRLIKKEDKDVEKKKLQQRLIAFTAAFVCGYGSEIFLNSIRFLLHMTVY